MELDGSLFKCVANPLDLDLILKLVLKHVGKVNTGDLLECRLVNRSWNRAAVYELEQHGYAIKLDYEKMKRFRSVLWKSSMSQFKQTGLSLTDQFFSLRLSLTIEVAENSHEHRSEMAEVAQFLTLYSKLRVAFINFSYDAGFNGSHHLLTNHELFKVLSLTSSTLTRITIYVNYSKSPCFDDDAFGTLEFPRLTSLRYRLFCCDTQKNDILDTTRQVLFIIKKSPSLTNLDLKIHDGSGHKSARSFQKLIQPCATNLEQLILRFGAENHDYLILSAMSEIKFPKLRKLKLINISNFIISEKTQEFSQHLKTNFPALTHFIMNSNWASHETQESELQLKFPIFQNLIYFGFYSAFFMRSDPEHLESVRATYYKMMSWYPRLIVLRLDLGVLLMLAAHLNGSGNIIPQSDKYQIFASIFTLEVEITFDYIMVDLAASAAQIYHHSFPNIQKLVIKLPKKASSNSADQEHMTQAIAFLCYHPEISAIEIRNYTQPWLEQMAEPILNLANCQGVKSLKIFPSKTDECPRQPDLPIILARFPKLEFLQFGKATMYKSSNNSTSVNI